MSSGFELIIDSESEACLSFRSDPESQSSEILPFALEFEVFSLLKFIKIIINTCKLKKRFIQ